MFFNYTANEKIEEVKILIYSFASKNSLKGFFPRSPNEWRIITLDARILKTKDLPSDFPYDCVSLSLANLYIQVIDKYIQTAQGKIKIALGVISRGGKNRSVKLAKLIHEKLYNIVSENSSLKNKVILSLEHHPQE